MKLIKFLTQNKASYLILSLLLILTSLFSFIKPAQAAAGINSTINFQGKVENSNGTNVADTSWTFAFNIYDSDTGGSSNLLWGPESKSITTTSGVFQTALGDTTSLSSLSFNRDDLWLQITFNSQVMSPRIHLTAAAYAMNAQKVNGLTVTNTSNNPFSSTTIIKLPDGNTYTVASPNSGTSDTIDTLTSVSTFTNKTIGSTGLVFSGASTDITTAAGEDLSLIVASLSTNSASGGALNLTGGDESASTSPTGGNTVMRAGNTTAAGAITGTATGGALNLNAGNAAGSSGTRNGGSISLNAGTGATLNGSINLGSTTAKAINLGNGTDNTTLTLTGSGLTTLGGSLTVSGTSLLATSATTVTLGSSGVDTINIGNGGADSISIGTAAAASTIAIGNASATNVSITDDNWSVSTAGLANFVSVGAATAGTGAFTTLTSTPASNVAAFTVTGTNVTSANLINVSSKNTSGTLVNVAYNTATLAGATVGQLLDLSTSVTNAAQSVTGLSLKLPATTAAATTTLKGLTLTGGAVTNSSGTSTWTGLDINMPAITQTSGTLTSVGLKVTGGTVTSGTSYALTTDATAGNVGIGVTAPVSLLNVGQYSDTITTFTLGDNSSAANYGLSAFSNNLKLIAPSGFRFLSGSATGTEVLNISSAGVVTLDGGQAADITSVSAANLTFAPSVNSAGTATGATLSLKGGAESGTSGATVGGPLVLVGGDATDTAGHQETGGAITITGGTTNGTGINNQVGGAVTITGGAATTGSSNIIGGNVTINGGSGVTANGNVFLGSTHTFGVTLGSTGNDTLNIGNGGADTITIGSAAAASTITIGNASATNVSITDDNWAVTTAGAATFSNLNLNGSGIITLPGAQTADITTASSGTSTALTFAPGVSTSPGGVGSNLTLRGSNESGGASSIGGKLILQGGTGVTNGNIEIGLANTNTVTIGSSSTKTIINTNAGDTTGDLLYRASTGALTRLAIGSGSQCLLGGTTPTWGACSGGGGSTSWDAITAPVAALNLNMYQTIGTSFATTFTYGNATSTTNLFNITDSSSNTGTGYLFNLATATSSTLKPLRVAAAGVEALAIDATGKVGIGTTGPGEKLEVAGKIKVNSGGSTDTIYSNNSTGLILESQGNFYGTVRLTLQNIGGSNGAVFQNVSQDLVDFNFLTSTGANKNIRFEDRDNVTYSCANVCPEFQFGTPGNPNLVTSDAAAIFRNGKVGIGQTAAETILTNWLQIAPNSVPTDDIVNVNNTSNPITTSGADGLQYDYQIGTGALLDNAGLRLNMTSAGANAGSFLYALNIPALTSPSSNVQENAIEIQGTNWDTSINIENGNVPLNSAYGGFGRNENKLMYSEQLDNAAWSVETSGLQVLADNVNGPDGTLTAESVADTSTAGTRLSQSITATNSETYTFSVWLKNNNATGSVLLKLCDNSIAGTCSSSTVTIASPGTTDWRRYSVTRTTAGSGVTSVVAVIDLNQGNPGSAQGIYAWGAQLEKQSTAGLYTKTTGSGTVSTGSSRGLIVNANLVNTIAGSLDAEGINFSDLSSASALGTNVNGIDIESLINTTGGATKSTNAINVDAPVLTACTSGACTFNGLKIATTTGTNLSANGAYIANGSTGPATGLTEQGVIVNGPSTGGAGTYKGFSINGLATTTSGTSTGLDITGSNSQTAGTMRGININSITAGTATEQGIKIGTGWDDDIFFATGATHTLQVETQSTAATAGSDFQILGATGNTSGAGGKIIITSGTGGSTGAGGDLNLSSGTAGGSNGAGGQINLVAGNGAGTGIGGAVLITAGNAVTGSQVGGAIQITSGNGAGGTSNAGAVTINTGTAVSTGTAVINIGSANSKTLNLGTATTMAAINIGSGAVAKTIQIGQATGGGTGADTILIGNSNVSKTITIGSTVTASDTINIGVSTATTATTINIGTGHNNTRVVLKDRTAAPGAELATNGQIMVGSVANTATEGRVWVKSNGINFRFNSAANSADYSEYMQQADTSEPGDVLVMSKTNYETVKRSTTSYDQQVLGVVTQYGTSNNNDDCTNPDGSSCDHMHDPHYANVGMLGQVYTKISDENGTIQPGDPLTTSDAQGVVMKATKKGRIVGYALDSYNGTHSGQDLMNLPTYPVHTEVVHPAGRPPQTVHVGKILILLQASWYDPDAPPPDIGQVAMNYANGAFNLTNTLTGEAINAQIIARDGLVGNLTAGQIDTQQLRAEDVVTKGFTLKDSNNNVKVHIDQSGNATFSGTLTADRISANHIDGLDVITDRVSAVEASAAATNTHLTALETAFNDYVASHSGQMQPQQVQNPPELPTGILSLEGLNVEKEATISGDLHVGGSSLIEGILNVIDTITTKNLMVGEWADFVGNAIFRGDTTFTGKVAFNKDTAGVAIVRKGANTVDVQFENEYPAVPVVTANLSIDDSLSIQDQQASESAVLGENIKYVITRKSTHGFTIKISENAPANLTFSWIALSVNSEATTSPTPTPSPLPTATPTITPSATPSPTVTISPTPTP